jgi:type I restriction enzyme S subunit
MKAWRPSTWGDEISLEYGKALRGYESAHGPVRVFGSNGPVGWTDKALATGPGVILGRKGAYRGVQYSEGDFFVIDTAYYVVPKTDLDMRWLYYAIQYHKLGEIDDGSPIPSTTRAAVYVRELDVPPKGVQREMARILESIDNKIDLNRRIDQTLEAMAQAIFQSWFVDFDPVKAKIAAKAEGRDPLLAAMSAISGKAEAELDALSPEQYEQLAATAALFPDEMEASGLGEIPKGWQSSTLGEICAAYGGLIQTGPFGSQLHARDYCDEGIPVVMPQDLSVQRIQTSKIARISESDAQRLQRHRMKQGDVVFSRRGDVGRHALVTKQEVGWLCGTGCLLVRPSTTSPISTYVSCALALPETLEWLLRHAVGATMPNLNTAILSELPMLSARSEVIAAFENFFSSLVAAKNSHLSEVSTLATLRDTLLPKLLSGELPVADAMVEADV